MTQIIFHVEDFKGQLHRSEMKMDPASAATLLDAAKQAGLPLLHACEGCCACSTCHVVVEEGERGLTLIQEEEEDRLDHAWNVEMGSRLACQARLLPSAEKVIFRLPRNSLDPAEALDYFAKIGQQAAVPSMEEVSPVETKKLNWSDPEGLAEALESQDPTLDLMTLRLTQLLDKIEALDGFSGRSEEVSESRLEAVLAAWLDLRSEVSR